MAELAALGAVEPRAVPGGVAFAASWQTCYAANLWSRLASRVLWRVGRFDYRDEHDLFRAVRAVDWPRLFGVERSLRVDLAAGLVLLSGWTPGEPLLDPMCGGGTILVEAAAIARARAPGAGRRFAFERLANFDPALWARVRAAAQPRAPARPAIYGSDTDARALAAARRNNLAAAGVERWVKIERAGALECRLYEFRMVAGSHRR